ncbi:ABC transporter permease [Variovorax sp. HJSM1_2]|uniref:ABC transporter permease n=1 Tax=Variovorax sp. HJSM1_2 TaxID=3366263 RepID=UPI003BD41AA0
MKWLIRNWDQVLQALGEHIFVSGSALLLAFAVSLPLGIWAARNQRVMSITLGISGVLYTIPTMALLALLIPIVGLGKTNAILAMVMFSLMILIRNVATGLREVPADVVDAARGMGMDSGQILRRIELPLAAPIIVAGLRVAAVTVISITVVAAFVNAGGLGNIIFSGMSSDHAAKIWVGALAACLLSVLVDVSLHAVENRLRKGTA